MPMNASNQEQRRAHVYSCVKIYYQATERGRPKELQEFCEEVSELVLNLPYRGLEKDGERIGKLLGIRSNAQEALKSENTAYEDNRASVAAIQFALEAEEGLAFLRYWNQGDFDVIRKEWPEAPEDVFIGADPLYKTG
ncbi:hypothetical protein KO116_P200205 (plasmid) [Halomonas sp. KO116]|nr:hypothetical protein KO116_P200205 [Halomonas sp. KO116]